MVSWICKIHLSGHIIEGGSKVLFFFFSVLCENALWFCEIDCRMEDQASLVWLSKPSYSVHFIRTAFNAQHNMNIMKVIVCTWEMLERRWKNIKGTIFGFMLYHKETGTAKLCLQPQSSGVLRIETLLKWKGLALQKYTLEFAIQSINLFPFHSITRCLSLIFPNKWSISSA